MQLRKFLGVLASRWKMIAAVTVLVIAVATVLTLLTTPVYTAQARIYLSTESQGRAGDSQGTFVLSDSDLDTYVSIVDTQAVEDPLREELGLPAGHPIDAEAAVTGSTSILTITARASDAQEAARVANGLGPQLAAVAGEFSTLLNASGQQVVSTPIQPAAAPDAPTSPDVPRTIALALLTGLALGVGVALLREGLETRVRTEEDVTDLTDAPMLASIPLDRSAGKGALLSLTTNPHGRHAEAVRRLRTNLLFVDVTTGSHSVVVTSAMPGEGKTTTAINLALAMADAGTRTLLVDADLRDPSVASSVGLVGDVGLTTVLLGTATPDDVVQVLGETGLHVLPAGQIPPNPSELLGSRPMEDLFATLSRDYDFIVVDSPPVVPVVDAVILDRLTGGLLMVVGSGTRKKDVASAVTQLQTVDASLSGIAHNLVASKRGDEDRYGYYRYVEPTRAAKKAKPVRSARSSARSSAE